jgi:uncharacterized protein (DUF885 family)
VVLLLRICQLKFNLGEIILYYFRKISMILLVFILFVFMTFSSCKKVPENGTETGIKAGIKDSSQLLKELGDEYWNYMLQESIELQIKHGMEITKLPDLSFTYASAQNDYAKDFMQRLQQVKATDLSHEEWISFEILKWDFANYIEGIKYYWLDFPVTPYTSPIRSVQRAFSTYQFKNIEDCDAYFELLAKVPKFTEAMLDKLKTQYEKKIILPKDEINLVVPFLNTFIGEGEKSPFYVSKKRLEEVEESKRVEFQKTLVEVIGAEINPALKVLPKFIEGDYLKKAPDIVGLWQYPDGKDYYQYLIRVQTTMDITPEEIHQIGLEQVDKIMEKVDKLRESGGFKGTRKEFLVFLKTDKRFFASTADEIGERLRSYMEGVSQKIGDYFLKTPEASYDVQRLAPELEGAMTFGFYQPPMGSESRGLYLYNGSKVAERSLLWAEGLLYHELVPGHHFHISLQNENTALPEFRKETIHNAFTEGWAEYASWVCLEMGLYKDKYSLCGKHMMDLFLTTRLVVDTGMNALEWPRNRAVKYMQERLVESETQILSETLRYSVDMPAQALGYKLGSMKYAELRKKAELSLGDKFDIRGYHEAILGSGSMPITVLEKHIDWFIEQELGK